MIQTRPYCKSRWLTNTCSSESDDKRFGLPHIRPIHRHCSRNYIKSLPSDDDILLRTDIFVVGGARTQFAVTTASCQTDTASFARCLDNNERNVFHCGQRQNVRSKRPMSFDAMTPAWPSPVFHWHLIIVVCVLFNKRRVHALCQLNRAYYFVWLLIAAVE